MKTGTTVARRHPPAGIARWPVIAAVLLVSACASRGDVAGAVSGMVRVTGVVVSIDTRPWAYDGSAIVQLDTADHGRLQVQLPARWNLCQAAPVDVEALAVGMRVEVVAGTVEEGAIVVCADPSHRLAPIDPATANAGGAR